MNEIRNIKMWKVYLSNKSFVEESIKKMIEKYHVLIGTRISIPIYDYHKNSYCNTLEFEITNIDGRNYFLAIV